MRRDVVTEIVLSYDDFEESFASKLEASRFIEANEDEYGLPQNAWLEDSSGNKKWYYQITYDAEGNITLVEGETLHNKSFYRPKH